MAFYYSKNGFEPKFGFFVRLIFGLPFVKVDDIPHRLKYIEKVGSQFKHKKFRTFASAMLSYLEKCWKTLPLEIYSQSNENYKTVFKIKNG